MNSRLYRSTYSSGNNKVCKGTNSRFYTLRVCMQMPAESCKIGAKVSEQFTLSTISTGHMKLILSLGNLKMSTFFVAYFSEQYISVDTCVCQQLVVRPQPLPGHFTFQRHSSSSSTSHVLNITHSRTLFHIKEKFVFRYCLKYLLSFQSILLQPFSKPDINIDFKKAINRPKVYANLKDWRSQWVPEEGS